MIKINITEEDKEIFEYERKNHIHPRVQQKMEVLCLKSKKLPHKVIAEIAGVSKNTVTEYLHLFKEGGSDKLKEIRFNKPESELTQHTSPLEAYFREHPPASAKEAMGKIEEITGLKRSGTQIRKFLGKIGLKRRKVGMVPAEADIEKQENLKKQEIEPRLKEAAQGKRKITDASHFVLAPFSGYLWSLTRIFIKVPAGRKRFNRPLSKLRFISDFSTPSDLFRGVKRQKKRTLERGLLFESRSRKAVPCDIKQRNMRHGAADRLISHFVLMECIVFYTGNTCLRIPVKKNSVGNGLNIPRPGRAIGYKILKIGFR
jgi:transposase